MYENLKMLKIPPQLIRLVKMTLTNSRAVVEVTREEQTFLILTKD